MAGFGGTIKLQGEQAYRQALKAIAADLKTVAAEQKLTASTYDKTDTSLSALSKRSDDLKSKLSAQQAKWDTLSKAIKDYQSQQEKNKASIQSVEAQLDKEKKKLAEIASQYGTTSKEYQTQAKVVDELEQQLKELNAQYDKNEVTIKQTKAALTSTEADMKKTGAEMKKLGEQAQKAGDDTEDLGDSAKDAGKKAKDAANDGFTVLKGALANLAARGAEVAIQGLKNLATAVINMGKESLSSYAQYEQLVGGVETLFKDSADQVQKYAAVAYKTAGVSANTYMETVTSFSASLLQGLGGDTKKAAEIADMAIIDMADNANKMGTSIESIQYAYQGFAKQNYTMLDNLKLGYGGTQAEMARLVNESGVMGKAFKATAENVKEIPFDKLIEAIHKTQENMGITGTTAKEASSTIEGSVNSMKAAWSNLLTSIADDNADLGKSVDEFVDSAITAGQNIIPRVKQIVEGFKKLVGSLVTDVFPKLKKEMPELTPLIEPLEWIIKNYKTVVTAIGSIIAAFVATKVTNFVTSIVSTVSALVNAAKAAEGFAGAVGGIGKAISANPFGLLVGAIVGVGTAIGGLIGSMSDAEDATDSYKKHLKEQKEAIDANRDSWRELKKTQQDSLDADMTQLTNIEKLKDELLNLVDANGKVKEGYEGRASFILGALNDALGTEYTMTDGVIQKYDELKNNIDQVIEKKKAEAILNSQQALYEEAITKQADAYALLGQIQSEQQAKQKELNQVTELYNSILENSSPFELNELYRSGYMGKIEESMKKLQDETDNLDLQYREQEDLLNEYAYNIGTYEQNMALSHEGRYDEMTTTTWNYVKDMQNAGDAQKAELEKNAKTLQTQLDHQEKLYKETGNEIYKTQAESTRKQLEENNKKLQAYNATTDEKLNKNVDSWTRNATKIISELTGTQVEFKDAGDGQVQMYADGVKAGEPVSKQKAKEVAQATVKEMDKKAEANGMGQNVITGFTNGTGNQSLWATAKAKVQSFASSVLASMKSALKEKSPSKATREMGQFLLEGLSMGITDEEKDTLKQAAAFGESVIDAMNDGMSEAVSTTAIQQLQNAMPDNLSTSFRASMAGASAEAAQMEQRSLISAFKQALSEMKIEMDDYEMGKFIDKTVTRAIYS